MEALLILWMLAYALLMVVFAVSRGHALHPANSRSMPKVSLDIIIPYRNEADHLRALLDALRRQQDAGSFRVLMVDDHSDDGSREKVEQESHTWEAGRLISLHLAEGEFGKKAALALGMKHSTAEIILFTDADALPPERWIATFRQAFAAHESCQLWCGPVMVEPGKTFLEGMQFLEYGSLMIAGRAALSMGWPLLASGASLGIRREAFHALGPDPWNAVLASGDDVYLLRRVWETFGKEATAFLWDKRALVTTQAEQSLMGMLRQRARWAGKTMRMKGKAVQFTGVLTGGANLFILAAILAAAAGFFSWSGLLICFGIKAFSEMGLAFAWSRFTTRWWPIFIAPLVSLTYPFLFLVVLVAGLRKRTTWKGRWLIVHG